MISLRRWRRANATEAIARWVTANRRDGLWRHGSQPPLLLRFAAEALLRTPVNIEYFPPNFEGLVLGCIDADFCK